MSDLDFFGPAKQQAATNDFKTRLAKARALLVRKGFNAQSAVFITAIEVSDNDLDPDGIPQAGPTFEVTGFYAAQRLAERTHRLSSDEEIARFKNEQKHREQFCDMTEAARPENKTKTVVIQQTTTTAPQAVASAAPQTVVSQPPTQAAAMPETAVIEPPARSAGKKRQTPDFSGEQEKEE